MNARSMMSRSIWTALLALLILIAATTVSSFSPQPSSIVRPATTTTTRLSALPKPKPYDPTYKSKPPTFNKQTSLWEPSPETEPQPYGPWGSFLRGGPTPFVLRLLQSDSYDQAVFKYMAQTSCSRSEAQGNMDAFFNNAADWAYQKGEEARGRPMVDYSELKPKQAVLVVTWAVLVTPFLGRCAYLIAATDKGWSITLDDIFNF
eukprot:CAMPEP_0181135046 /NCGR_PEP_ID=MMETSP1071-20121207/32416_1 /TAXON_ID=35127 /ORGANISM="Thalassiosira sp., Strain NH16" /LENGTH=204 /DNA_ID=CAMNT_0023221613 /DNA_START=45 /DNA_END=659 /DNA_ORIENTATION=-